MIYIQGKQPPVSMLVVKTESAYFKKQQASPLLRVKMALHCNRPLKKAVATGAKRNRLQPALPASMPKVRWWQSFNHLVV